MHPVRMGLRELITENGAASGKEITSGYQPVIPVMNYLIANPSSAYAVPDEFSLGERKPVFPDLTSTKTTLFIFPSERPSKIIKSTGVPRKRASLVLHSKKFQQYFAFTSKISFLLVQAGNSYS